MAKMSKNAETGKYELIITPAVAAQTTTLSVSGKYCDADIDVKTSAMPEGSVTPSVDSLVAPSVAVSGAASGFTAAASATSYYVTVTGSPTNGSVKAKETRTAGYVAAGNSTSDASTITPGITGSGSKVYIPVATYGTSNTGTNQKTVTPSTSAQYVNITAGYTPASKITISAMPSGSLSNEPTDDVTYTENTSDGTVIPANGYLYINAGYFGNTKISLSHLIPDPTTGETNVGASQMRSGYVAYDGSGNKIVGTMATVTPTFTGGAPTLTSKSNAITVTGMDTLASGTSSYYVDARASAKATRTAVTYAAAYTGYINKSSGTSASAAQTEASAETIDATRVYIPAAAGSVEVTTTLTKVPTLARKTFTITNVTDASNGAATTTAPTSGVYIKIGAAANTATTTATAKVTTAGYSPTNNSFATSGTITYGSAAATDAYIPIKTGTVAMPTSISVSGGTASVDANGVVTVSKSSVTIAGKSANFVAGWISSNPSTSAATVSVSAQLTVYDGSYTTS